MQICLRVWSHSGAVEVKPRRRFVAWLFRANRVRVLLPKHAVRGPSNSSWRITPSLSSTTLSTAERCLSSEIAHMGALTSANRARVEAVAGSAG